MICAVSTNRTDVNLYDTEKLLLRRLSPKEALKCLVKTNFRGVAGLRLADDSQMEDVLDEKYKNVFIVGKMDDGCNPYEFQEDSIILRCDDIRPYMNRSVLQFNREDFKMFFKSGSVLLIWSKGYLYEIVEKGGRVYLNGKGTSWGYMPVGIGYVVEEPDKSYSLYLRDKWVNVDGKHIRYCINHEVMYGDKASVQDFMREYKRFK